MPSSALHHDLIVWFGHLVTRSASEAIVGSDGARYHPPVGDLGLTE
jgi:hypothetical protein